MVIITFVTSNGSTYLDGNFHDIFSTGTLFSFPSLKPALNSCDSCISPGSRAGATDPYHRADNQKRAGLKLNKINYEIETAQNLFLKHWPFTGFLPGSMSWGYKTHPGREFSDQSAFPMRDTGQIPRNKMPKHHPYFHLRLLCFKRLSSLPLPLKVFFTATEGNWGIFLLSRSAYSQWYHRLQGNLVKCYSGTTALGVQAGHCISQLSPKYIHQSLC